ncbi:MAG: THO complex subunit 2 [Thelocarpon impressellum]|nr:MAG: THO complex subunit 2 [Thelocarpon impressellum]
MRSTKRKRGDRSFSQDAGNDASNRPSPHRPGSLHLGQQSREQENRIIRGGGGRRFSRGGRGGSPQSPTVAFNASPVGSRPPPSAMSPPLRAVDGPKPPPPTLQMQTQVQAEPPAEQAPRPDPPIYAWEHLTDDNLSAWRESGRKAVVDAGMQARLDGLAMPLTLIFQELLEAALRRRIDATEAGTVARDIIGADIPEGGRDLALSSPTFDPAALFLDVLSILAENDESHASSPLLRGLVFATSISTALMRQILEVDVLKALGLVRPTFSKMGIRKTTNLLYRQSNYNLLREETEGYSKLVTELFTTSGSQPPSNEVVQETFERIKALVGAFDLDVGRVLDVTLDVFASVLVKQYRFFIKFLRASSWWPKGRHFDGVDAVSRVYADTLPPWALPNSTLTSNDAARREITENRGGRDTAFWDRAREVKLAAFFELGHDRVASLDSLDNARTEPWNQADVEWIRAHGWLPPTANRVAAQLLGFKLRFYASDARDPSDVLPVNLIYLAALLIKVKFISLHDLYPHLFPGDEDMAAVKEAKFKEKAEKEKLNRPGGGAANALMMAGALSDDTYPGKPRETDGSRGAPATKPDPAAEKAAAVARAEEKERLPDPSDQKVQLLKSLLCIGAIPEALFILGRFPWLPEVYPEVPELLHRVLHHSLSRVSDALQPLGGGSSLGCQREDDDVLAVVLKGQPRAADRRVLRWALPDKDDASEPADYRFYWDDWADNIPICQSVDDVFTLADTLLNYSGVKIGRDPVLLVKLVRIGRRSLADDQSQANTSRWIDLSKRVLVPALSLAKSSPSAVNEVFTLLKHFDTKTRYSIYAEWYHGATSRLPDIKSAFDQSRAETKDVLKRISKTNVKLMARSLAKVASSSPGIVFTVAMAQIESYDNLVEVVVECARYFTNLGFDVLTWALMSSLGSAGRTRVQADGMLTSKWLGSLSLFAGRVFKRYHTLMNPTPILQYVTVQVAKGNATDLIVLKEIITSMAGIVSDANLNESQILAMAGGALLRQQTLLQLLDKRHESRVTARRLMKSLTEPAGPKLAGRLLVTIAQGLQTCVFGLPEPDSHLKLLGNLSDEIYRVLAQYLDLLRNNLTAKEFDAQVPSVPRLIRRFGLEPRIAFWIGRQSIAAEMRESLKEIERLEAAKASGAEVGNSDDGPSSADKPLQQSATPESKRIETSGADHDMAENVTNGSSGEAEGLAAPDESAKSSDAATNGDQLPWLPPVRRLMEDVRPAFPEDVWSNLSISFYVTFWQLSLYDIQVNTKSYDEELTRLKHKWIAARDDRSDMSSSGVARKEERKKHLTGLQDSLHEELKGHIQAFSLTRARLSKEKDHWFADFFGKWDTLNLALIQCCFLPRLLLSPHDALFSFKMLKTLHAAGTPSFRTIGVIDHLLREGRVSNTIFLCTSREAENLGRFLNELLKDLGRWHADRGTYEKEAFGSKRELWGFAVKVTKEKGPECMLEYEDFRRLLYKWHKNINAALKNCLTGGEYMHIRNAIIVLKGIHQYFPAVNWIGRDQITSVTELINSEKREDLKISATSLLGNLKRREKQWMLPQAFNLIDPVLNGANGVRASVARSVTPKVEQAGPKKKLSPEAPDFKPSSQPTVNGVSRAQPMSRKSEVEDGEINDAKAKDIDTRARVATETTEVAPQGEAQKPQVQITSLPDMPAAPKASTATEAAGTAAALGIQPDPGTQQAQSHGPDPSIARTQLRGPDAKAQFNDRKHPGLTPPSLPSMQARPDFSRTPSTNIPPARGPHSLPSRPEQYPTPPRGADRRVLDRPGDRKDSREPRFPDHGRQHLPVEYSREHAQDRRQDHLDSARRAAEIRTPERPAVPDRERKDPGWGGERDRDHERSGRGLPVDRMGGPPVRDSRPPLRNGDVDERTSWDRPVSHDQHAGSRSADIQIQPSRESPMAPPRSSIPQHPDRANLISSDMERQGDRRGRSSRPQSPRRGDDRSYQTQPRFTAGRHDDRPAPNDQNRSEGRSREEDSHPPTGPRGERGSKYGGAEPGPTAPERSRDLFIPSAPPPRPKDPDHGRLNQDARPAAPPHDLSYGRLNSNAGADIPSGPRRNAGGRGGRNTASGPQPTVGTRGADQDPPNQHPVSVAPERHPPTGPSARGGPRSMPSSAPPGQAANKLPADLAGVHPDRREGLRPPPDAPASDRNPTSQAEAVVATAAAVRGTEPPLQAAMPPSGPRRPQPRAPSPADAMTNSRAPPTGPASASDRSRDKRFAGIQNVLQQTGNPAGPTRDERGTSIRGRAGRSSGVAIEGPVSGSPTPGAARPDLFSDRSNGPAGPGQGPPGEEDGSAGWAGRAREGDGRRSGRHHTPRSQSHDREREPGRREEVLGPRREENRDPRDRRSSRDDGRRLRDGAGERERERDQHRDRDRRESGRDGRDMRDMRIEDETRPPMWGGERRGVSERRDERERDGQRREPRKRMRGGEDLGGDKGPGHGEKRARRNA